LFAVSFAFSAAFSAFFAAHVSCILLFYAMSYGTTAYVIQQKSFIITLMPRFAAFPLTPLLIDFAAFFIFYFDTLH